MSLSFDTSRCDGNQCLDRLNCLRFTDRNTGSRNSHMTAPAPSENCAFKITQSQGQGVKTTNPRTI